MCVLPTVICGLVDPNLHLSRLPRLIEGSCAWSYLLQLSHLLGFRSVLVKLPHTGVLAPLFFFSPQFEHTFLFSLDGRNLAHESVCLRLSSTGMSTSTSCTAADSSSTSIFTDPAWNS